jgi:hypothetical protein
MILQCLFYHGTYWLFKCNFIRLCVVTKQAVWCTAEGLDRTRDNTRHWSAFETLHKSPSSGWFFLDLASYCDRRWGYWVLTSVYWSRMKGRSIMVGAHPSESRLTSLQTVQSSTMYSLSLNSCWIQLKIRDFVKFYSLFNNTNHRTTKLLNILWLKVL